MAIDPNEQVGAPATGNMSAAPLPSSPYRQEPIAVVGMACRLPGQSNSPGELWKFLERGGIADNTAPETRFDLKTHHDGSKKPKTMRSPGGMFLEKVDIRDFDAAFFGISTTDAVAMDPQQRQLLEVVYECLENSGTSMEKVDGAPVACFVGSYAVDYADMHARDPDSRPPGVTIGVGRAILSNRISHFFNFKGPSMTIDTACSGSLVGVDVACRYLSSGEADGAVICGANLYLSPEHNMDSGAMKGASSLTGRCWTFDARADGYIKAEGINAVYLKRLSDAVRDNDPIRAVIRGTATNSDGRTPGIASPSSEAQAKAIRASYANAGLSDFSQTTYLECHGTGTPAGDPQEVQGAASVFSATRDADHPLIIGSIKSNIGHSEPAAGVSGLIKAVLATEKGIIPGNPTFERPNPKIDFPSLKVRATRTTIPWPKAPFRRASVNSFGYGGSNAHAIVEEAGVLVPAANIRHTSSYASTSNFFDDDEDEDDNASVAPRPHLVTVSANNDLSLKASIAELRRHLLNPNTKIDLADLAYTLNERRSHHFYRSFAIPRKVNKLDEGDFVFGKKSASPIKIAFVLTGQGAQWSRMGQELVETFPQAARVLKHLDDVLQTTPNPPSWSLLRELTEPRSPEMLRVPEFAQPLTTALQLAMISVLEEWGIKPVAVVGHSSGEIAAAYTAGKLSKEDAIKAAFYRGQAAKAHLEGSLTEPLGMLAVGLGSEQVADYLRGLEDSVQIACYNSPSSVTLSGTVTKLNEAKDRLTADKHFARMLQVNLAYHSKFMNEIGATYRQMLEADFEHFSQSSSDVAMFSSVTGLKLDGANDIDYWVNNMVGSVKFNDAVRSMLSSDMGVNYLVEIGPSGALAGPLSQIMKDLGGQAAKAQYVPALKRGKDSVLSMFDVVGKLYLSGADIDFSKVNASETGRTPSVIIDLPNYAWDHSTKYWYENESSKDWRYRLFPHHDLLGSKILGTPWQNPVWKKSLFVHDTPWLKDHKMGNDIVFPAAGFMAMAIEAIKQKNEALATLEGAPLVTSPAIRLRNVTFPKALVLEEGDKPARIMIGLAALAGPKDAWHGFKVHSLRDDVWSEHCRGLIRIDEDVVHPTPEGAIAPLEDPVPGALWYKAMNDAGYNFGPMFQPQLEVESLLGHRHSRSLVSLEAPVTDVQQSEYPLHPAALDGCLQTCAPSLWAGNRSGVTDVLIPAIIDNLLITSTKSSSGRGISVSSAKHNNLGRQDQTKNFISDATVYDSETGNLIFKLSGLRYHKLEAADTPYDKHHYSRLLWKPDITFLTEADISHLFESDKLGKGSVSVAQGVIDLAAHKKPNLRVLEINTVPKNTDSLWLEGSPEDHSIRDPSPKFSYVHSDAAALLDVQEKYGEAGEFIFTDVTQDLTPLQVEDSPYDLIVFRSSSTSSQNGELLQSLRSLLSDNGHLLVLQKPSEVKQVDGGANGNGHSNGPTETPIKEISESLTCLKELTFTGDDRFSCASLFTPKKAEAVEMPRIDVVSFSVLTIESLKVIAKLEVMGWHVQRCGLDLSLVRPGSVVLVLDELVSSIFPELLEEHWVGIQTLLGLGNRVLWTTCGSQFEVKDPNKAMIHGLGRSVRNEDPSVSLTTLDVSSSSGQVTAIAVDKVLKTLVGKAPVTRVENELVERGGVIHVSRVIPDHLINRAEQDDRKGAEPVEQSLHANSNTVRMRCERLGNIDSICFAEVDSKPLPLMENRVEVEIAAAGLNFKDVAVSMGIVPENEYLLGLEGAGTVRRVHPSVKDYHVGQRVLVFEKGTFANRIIATTERVYPIPDSMTFEEASTLASVYLTALYSIYDLAGTKAGDRVLIHSASGGLGIASIQICQQLGAEVFATVGTDSKRQFLKDSFGIPDDHIFNSRTTEFGPALMLATKGYGVDVILNSLTGDLLDESWRCIANGGTMVELGKKDMLDRNGLSMEPFGRNASYRCFDMSHKHVSDALIARLLKQLFGLLEQGLVKPIAPIKTFAFDDIHSAFRFMRGANHIGKIVVTMDTKEDVTVPIRKAPRTLRINENGSILIIGGLKGLCGSLALYLARLEAKNFVILGRSGYDDERSRITIKNLTTFGCNVDLIKGDVANLEDVRRTFKSATVPISGIIQGAMVLRDKVFTAMTIRDYHTAIQCKVAGSWNLHNVALEENITLDFFTMLSSISGLTGQKGQANYAAANVFLDNFAVYRRQMGLAANSVDLGAIEDVGYMSQHSDLLVALDSSAWTPINEALFHKIVRFSLLQQADEPINPASTQLITSLAVPQSDTSRLLADARFGPLCFGSAASSGSSGASAAAKELNAFLMMAKAATDMTATVDTGAKLINKQFVNILRLPEPMEPAKPLSAYGLDSLAAVEFRNWARSDLGVELTTLEITNAASLLTLAEKIVGKLSTAGEAKAA